MYSLRKEGKKIKTERSNFPLWRLGSNGGPETGQGRHPPVAWTARIVVSRRDSMVFQGGFENAGQLLQAQCYREEEEMRMRRRRRILV